MDPGPAPVVIHSGWTDPRDRRSWHVMSFRQPDGTELLVFRVPGTERRRVLRNDYGVSCERLEDEQLENALDRSKWTKDMARVARERALKAVIPPQRAALA